MIIYRMHEICKFLNFQLCRIPFEVILTVTSTIEVSKGGSELVNLEDSYYDGNCYIRKGSFWAVELVSDVILSVTPFQ